MSLNKNKKIVLGCVIFAFVLSIGLAWIMAKNYKVDVNKERFKLTKDYQEAKDATYTFNEQEGRSLYEGLCSRCHGERGEGLLTAPPLKGAVVLEDQAKTLKIVIYGQSGKIKRNNKDYNSLMPPFKMVTHKDLADVINFVRKNFANQEASITPIEIIEAKVDFIQRNTPYTEEEL